jgi:hypothetical protein
VPEGLRELRGLPPVGDIGVHLVSRDGLADTITHASATMLTSFLASTVASGTVRPPAGTVRRYG